MRTDLSGLVISPSATLREALQAIDAGKLGIALVVEGPVSALRGTVTDGDARRAVLRGLTLESAVTEVMNRKFVAVSANALQAGVLDLMRLRSIKQIPVVETDGSLLGLHYLGDFSKTAPRPNWAVIIAGGEGRRLRPLTERTPKSMLPIGERPILENLVRLLVSHRFSQIFIAINYLGAQIQDHFGDGTAFDCNITYLRESKPLGTAGALSLLPQRPSDPLLVLNGDLVTDVDVSALMDFHTEAACLGTQCVFEYVHQVPFGVVQCDAGQVIRVDEKPSYKQLINAGIYVLSPSLVDLVPGEAEFTMPELLSVAHRNGYPVAAFPIRERWADIGQLRDYEWARDHWDVRQTETA